MRYHLRRLLICSILFTALFSACRDEPKLNDLPKENIVKARLGSEPENLNFLLTGHSSAVEIFKLISVPLASFDPKTYLLTPSLIKKMPVSQAITEGEFAGTIAYDFEILEEATWDNGTPITAEDVLFTLKAVANPNYASVHASFTSFIKGFEINQQNPKNFRVYGVKYLLAGPVISNFEAMPRYVYDPEGLLNDFTLTELKDPANKERLAADEKLKAFATKFSSAYHLNKPEGISYSGPYKVESWTSGQEIVLVKKKNWWGDKLADKYPILTAKPSKIIYKIIPDINAAISLAKNGELDILGKIEWTQFVQLKEDQIIKDQYNFYTPEKIAYRFICLNNASPKLEDKRVRQALDYLFDRAEVFKTVYYGLSKPIVGPIHPTKPYYNKNLSPRSFNLEKAKSLLKEAGWADSNGNGIVDKKIDGEVVEMDINLLYANGYKDYTSMALIFSNNAKKAGVNIVPVTVETKVYFNNLKSKDFDAAFLADDWYPLNKDLVGRYHSKGSSNYGSFATAESDEVIKTIRRTLEEDKLAVLYTKAQEIIFEETPSIFINSGEDRIIVNKKFGAVNMSAVKPHYQLNEFAIKQNVPVTSSAN